MRTDTVKHIKFRIEHPGIWRGPSSQCMNPGWSPVCGAWMSCVWGCGCLLPPLFFWCKGGRWFSSQSAMTPLYTSSSPSDTQPAREVSSENLWRWCCSQLCLKSDVCSKNRNGESTVPCGVLQPHSHPVVGSRWSTSCWWRRPQTWIYLDLLAALTYPSFN